MNLKEIVDLCKSGDAAGAYIETQKQLTANPDDHYARVGAAYSIKAMMENAAAEGDHAEVVRFINEYADLKLDETDEAEMNNRLAWPVRSYVVGAINRGQLDFEKAGQLANALKRVNFLKPHRYYSVILDTMLKIRDSKTIWPGISAFISWWGLENLLAEDYKRVLLSNGQPVPALAERAYTAALKAFVPEVSVGRLIREAESFIGDLEVLEETHPEYSGILYQKSLLLKAMGRPSEALAAARAFVRKRPNEYWAWSALGDVADDEEMRAACYCRALQCRMNPQFQGKVRYKLAVTMYNLGQMEYARREFEKIAEMYTRNGWHLPGNLEGIMSQQWYQNTVPAMTNRDFYMAFSPRAEEYLNNDVAEMPVLISNFNAQKQIAGFVTADRKRGFFSTRKLPMQFANYQICMVRFDGDISGEKGARVVSCRRAEDVEKYKDVLYRQIEAPLGLRPGQSFLFVDDIYVDGNLMRGMQPDTMCAVTAVLYYNIKKNSWGWRAVRINPIELNS